MPIDGSKNIQEWFSEKKLEIKLYPEDTIQRFDSLNGLIDFIQNEEKYWRDIDSDISDRFHAASICIQSAISARNSDQTYQSHVSKAASILRNPVWDENGGKCLVFSATQLAKDLKSASERYNKDGYRAFFTGVLFKRLRAGNFANRFKDEYFGLFDAYIYKQLSETLEQKVSASEAALTKIQSQFNALFYDCTNSHSLHKEKLESIKGDYDNWKSDSTTSFAEQSEIHRVSQQELAATHHKSFNTNEKNWKKRISELENLYQNKLMLEAPVKYWKELEEKYRKTGFRFALATTLTIIAMVTILTTALYRWPPTWLEAGTWDLNTLKGCFLLITITSLALYIVHFLAKFTVSSYHLARDAEERKQLTYIYLSLQQQKAVSPDQQKIIIQALFSRADTGLLKGDHAPAMPASQIMSMIK